jgi:hypothetical protein
VEEERERDGALPERGGRGQVQEEQSNSRDKDGAARIRESRGEKTDGTLPRTYA